VRSEGFYVNENSTDTSWARTSDLPICSTATVPPRSPYTVCVCVCVYIYIYIHIYMHARARARAHTHTHTTHIYSWVCYNEQILSIKSGCHNERGGIISADVARFFCAFLMESSTIVFTREILFLLFMYVRLFMLFTFTCPVYKS
jgi:hypothetical protein